MHFDISHNKLWQKDVADISKGVIKNHAIMGLHMNGNDAAVDSLGFVKPDMGFGKVKTSHIFNRILDDEVNNSDNNEWR